MAEAVERTDELVREYLLFRGFTHTLRQLDAEIKADKEKGFRVRAGGSGAGRGGPRGPGSGLPPALPPGRERRCHSRRGAGDLSASDPSLTDEELRPSDGQDLPEAAPRVRSVAEAGAPMSRLLVQGSVSTPASLARMAMRF